MKHDSPHSLSQVYPSKFWQFGLVVSLTAQCRHKSQTEQLFVNLCVLALDKMENGRRAHHTACLVNRSANSAFCALLVFLVMGTSLWWTFSLCCRENCYFSSSHCLTYSSSFLITPSFALQTCSQSYLRCCYLRCCSRISYQCGCWTWGGMIPTGWQEVKMWEKGGRTEIEGGNAECRLVTLILKRDELCCIHVL